MRAPTPPEVQMAWHSNALLGVYGDEIAAAPDTPCCGWFKRRLVKGGPFVPARIWLEQDIDPETGELLSDEIFRCEIDGRATDAYEAWSYLCAHPITEAQWRHMVSVREWAGEYARNDPAVNARQKIDWLAMPVVEF